MFRPVATGPNVVRCERRRRENSPAFQRWVSRSQCVESRQGRQNASSEQRILERKAVRLKHRCILLAKGSRPMMLCLIANVRDGTIYALNADTKRAVALLPGKEMHFRKCFSNPFR